MLSGGGMIAACFTSRLIKEMADKAISLMVCFTIFFNPLIPAFGAIQIENGIDRGQSIAQEFWSEIKDSYSSTSHTDGQSLNGFTKPDGSKIMVHELFQAESQDSSFKSMFQLTDDEFKNKGKVARENLYDDKTPTGDAFTVLRESAYKSKPDLTNDPMWGSTERVFGALAGEDMEECKSAADHTPIYKTCESLNSAQGACDVEHPYTIKPVMAPESGASSFASCGEGCIELWLGQTKDGTYSGQCTIHEEVVKIRMLVPDAIISAVVTDASVDDYLQFWAINESDDSAPKDLLWSSHSIFPPESIYWDGAIANKWDDEARIFSSSDGNTYNWDSVINSTYFGGTNIPEASRSGSCERKSSDVHKPNKDITDLLKSRSPDEVVDFKLRTSVAGTGEGFVRVKVTYDPAKLIFDDFYGNPSCLARAHILYQNEGQSYATCNDIPDEVKENGCYVVSGSIVCPQHMADSGMPADVAASTTPFCRNYVIDAPLDLGLSSGATSCKALEDDPRCGYVKSSCKDSSVEDQARDFFEYGLARSPSSGEYNMWLAELKDKDYDDVRSDFFRWAKDNNEPIINSFSCKVYEEVYDCGYPEEGYSEGACQIKDLLENDFADCTEEMVPGSEPKIITMEEMEICEEALLLTECSVKRNIDIVARNASQALGISGCISSNTHSFQVPWKDSAATAVARVEVTYADGISYSITQQPSESNGWLLKGVFTGQGKIDPITQNLVCPGTTTPKFSGRLVVEGYSAFAYDDESPAEVGNDPCLRDSDTVTDVQWSCSQQEAMPISYSALANAINPIGAGLPINCTDAKATYHTSEYGQGDFCWVDLNGQQQCETLDDTNSLKAGSDNCADLRNRTSAGECRYIGRYPIEGGAGISDAKFQYAWEHRYSCDGETYETEPEMVPQYTCEGIVRCMGTECMTPNRETSESFSKAVGMLQAMQQVDGDVSCDVSEDGGMINCQVFAGEAATCKQALGTYIDCCESPGGITMGDYVVLAKESYKIGNLAFNGSEAGTSSGAFSLLDTAQSGFNFVTETWTTASDLFSGASTTATTSTTAGSAGGAWSAAVDEFISDQLTSVYDYMYEEWGAEVADTFLTSGGGLSEGLASTITVIGWIYTAYVVATIVAQMIWKCTEDELSLGVDRQLKKTHYVGSYCSSKVLGSCIEKQQVYCKFSAPLPRIINEQVKVQLGTTFGTPKAPNCEGVKIEDLSRLNWNIIDLSEWLDILNVTGNMPSQQDLDLTSLTGANSFLGKQQAKDDPDFERLDTAERNIERLKDADIGALNRFASDNLWSQE